MPAATNQTLVYQATAPDWYLTGALCSLSCRGVWREVGGRGGKRGWQWSCDKRDCEYKAETLGGAFMGRAARGRVSG